MTPVRLAAGRMRSRKWWTGSWGSLRRLTCVMVRLALDAYEKPSGARSAHWATALGVGMR